jgi:hypothetical protein
MVVSERCVLCTVLGYLSKPLAATRRQTMIQVMIHAPPLASPLPSEGGQISYLNSVVSSGVNKEPLLVYTTVLTLLLLTYLAVTPPTTSLSPYHHGLNNPLFNSRGYAPCLNDSLLDYTITTAARRTIRLFRCAACCLSEPYKASWICYYNCKY